MKVGVDTVLPEMRSEFKARDGVYEFEFSSKLLLVSCIFLPALRAKVCFVSYQRTVRITLALNGGF